MDRKEIHFAAGVELMSERTEQFKTGLFSVTLTVPLRKETATSCALTADVLYRGSRLHPDIMSLSSAADDLYGAALEVGVRQRGESQSICLQCSFVDDIYALDGSAILEPAIALVGEVLLDPLTEDGVFCEDYVAGEAANLADRIRARINDKSGWAVYRLLSEMCCDEAFGLDKMGDAEEALRITPEELWERYQWLLDEAVVTFYYNGSAAHTRVEQTVRRVFAPLLTHRDTVCGCEVIPRPQYEVKRVSDVMDVTQGKLAMGFRTGGITMADPRYPALLVCNTLYGGSATSKLFLNVRERLSLCYFASSMIDKLKGVMMVISGVDFANFEIAENEILSQLDAIRRGEFTEEELNAAIRAVVSGLISRKDSQSQQEDDAVSCRIGLGFMQEQDDLIRSVEQVTVQQIMDVADSISLDTVYRLRGREVG